MKVIRYTLLILLCLFLINLLSYFLFGKQSLRERNVSEMMKTNFYFVDHNNSVFPLISNLNLDDGYILNGYKYPVFTLEEFSDSNSIVDKYSDSLLNMQYFSIDKKEAETLLNTNFEAYEDWKIDSIVSENFMTLISSVEDSLVTLPKNQTYSGDCANYFQIVCRVYEKWPNFLYEEIKADKLFYIHQYLEFKLYLDHVSSYREEKLLWLFYKWVQIDWIDGNGLGGDDPSSKR